MERKYIVLMELLKASLFGIVPVFPDNTDWGAVFDEAKAQTVVALTVKAVPKEYLSFWEESALQSQGHFVRVLHGQTQLVNLFETEGIPLVILKGMAAAVYYPEPFRRAMGDVDFLVPPERFDEALTLMHANGYSQFGKDDRHAEFMKDGIEFELHHHFSSEGLQVEEVLIDGLAQAEVNAIGSSSFPVLPSMGNGFVLLVHVAFHLKSGQLGLRQVIDWMMYVHSCLDDRAWDYGFRELTRRYGLEKLAVTLTYLCKKCLGLPDQVSFAEEADPVLASKLLYVIFSAGNFGKKKGNAQSIERVSNNVFKAGLFHYLQIAGLKHWDTAKKYPVLRPVAWIYFMFHWAKKGRHLLLEPLKTRKEIMAGKQLYQLNKQLGLYDITKKE